MSINTLPHKMVALKVIQWDLTDRILRGLSKCFIMQFSWLQCNLMYLSFLAFHNFSLHQFAAGSAGAGSPAGRRGGGGGATISDSNYTKVLYVRSHLLLNFTLLLTCTSLQWKRQKLSIRTFLPSHYFSQLILNGAFIWFLKRPKIEFGKLWRSFLFLLVHI